MTVEAWHAVYAELVRDRDTQARHVAALDDELHEERQKAHQAGDGSEGIRSSTSTTDDGQAAMIGHAAVRYVRWALAWAIFGLAEGIAKLPYWLGWLWYSPYHWLIVASSNIQGDPYFGPFRPPTPQSEGKT